jgi:hypothetical protein
MSGHVRESEVLVADEVDWRGLEKGEVIGTDVFGVFDALHTDVVNALFPERPQASGREKGRREKEQKISSVVRDSSEEGD